MRFNSSSLSVFSPLWSLIFQRVLERKKCFDLEEVKYPHSLSPFRWILIHFQQMLMHLSNPIGESFLEKWQFSLEKTSFFLKWNEFQTREDDASLSVKRKDLAIWSDGITIMSYHMRRISAATRCNLQRYLRIMKREEY